MVVLASALISASVLLFLAGNKLTLPGGLVLKGNAEEILNKTGVRFSSELSRVILQKKIVQADLDLQPEYFTGLQIAMPLLILVFFLPLSAFGVLDIYWALLPAIVAYFIPGMWLNNKAKTRIAKIKSGIPEFSVMFGNALMSSADTMFALEHVSASMDGELAKEIRKTLNDRASGDTNSVALEKLAKRCEIPELTDLIRKIQRAMRYGGSNLHEVVIHHAEKMLSRQRFEAQKTAGELTIKLLVPIIVFILFPLFVFIGFPVVWSMLEIF